MKPASAELKESYIQVHQPKDVGKLYGKSRFGITQTGNTLKLSFIEALFLMEEQKLRVFQDKKEVFFDQLVHYAAAYDDSFETNYLVFQDLRKRGLQLDIGKPNQQFTFFFNQTDHKKKDQNRTSIIAFSERETTSFLHLTNLLDSAEGPYWIAVADEEGDITYYTFEALSPTGNVANQTYRKTTGLLLANRVILFHQDTGMTMHQNEFFGKPFAQGLQLSLVEAAHLTKKRMLQVTTSQGNNIQGKNLLNKMNEQQPNLSFISIVYEDLKNRKLIVKTGFKFGTHFRAYTQKPNKTHAEYLIHAVNENDHVIWSELSRAVRLAHAVNKKMIFALVQNKGKSITYLSMSRLRP